MTDQNAPITEYDRSVARQSLVTWLCLESSCMYGPNGCSCVERVAQMLSNTRAAALAAKNAEIGRLVEDRARFPDKPDGFGLMIEAHIGNLKKGKEEADRHALAAMDRSARQATELAKLREALHRYGDHLYECDIKNRNACSCGYEVALIAGQREGTET